MSGAQRAGRPAARGVWEEIRVAVGGRGCSGGLLSLQSVLGSAGVSGYVTVIIMRGRPGLAVCQPLAILRCLSYDSSRLAE